MDAADQSKSSDVADAQDEQWRSARPSSLGLIVLWQLFEGPKHVYRIQKLLLEQGKSRVVNVRSRASLYQTLERLMRLGLVEVKEKVRQHGYPDRIVYAITETGQTAAREWLRDMLRATGSEYPEFVAALSILFGLAPDDAALQLEARVDQLATAVAETEETLEASAQVPRLFLLEDEYQLAVLKAQLDWLQALIADLRQGRLTWSEEWLRAVFDTFHQPDEMDDVS